VSASIHSFISSLFAQKCKRGGSRQIGRGALASQAIGHWGASSRLPAIIFQLISEPHEVYNDQLYSSLFHTALKTCEIGNERRSISWVFGRGSAGVLTMLPLTL